MRRPFPYSLFPAAALVSMPSLAANATTDSEVVTGLGNTGIGFTIIAIAAALLLTLVFRGSATRVARIVTQKIGKRRIHKILHARSHIPLPLPPSPSLALPLPRPPSLSLLPSPSFPA